MTAIVDYGVGNLFSLRASLHALGAEAVVTGREEDLRSADRIILPGVGAFGQAMDKLRATGLIPYLQKREKPLLGICLGMQMLFEQSEEYGLHDGLGLLPGRIVPLAEREECRALKVPHMGWNALRIRKKDHPIVKNTPEGTHVYFVHSFYAVGCGDALIADSEYGVSVPALVGAGNVVGSQFHPEKSGPAGLALLRAFLEMEA